VPVVLPHRLARTNQARTEKDNIASVGSDTAISSDFGLAKILDTVRSAPRGVSQS